MGLLNDLMQIGEGEDLSRLPKDVMSSIKSNIRKGAEDLKQKWANALELVHKAYEVEGVERPDPTMETAWKQYEENLQYAVNQLAENRGMEDDWRMSSSMFREAREQKSYKVKIEGPQVNESFQLNASSFDDVVEYLKENTSYDVDVHQNSLRNVTVGFSRWGIRKKIKVNIERT